MIIENISKIDKYLRPIIIHNFPKLGIELYTNMRKSFLKHLVNSAPDIRYLSDGSHITKIWGLSFNCNLFNSAGIFKNGDGYELCFSQGAGAFLAGTTTFNPRLGNSKNGIFHPFVPLPNSKAAINWMGLPNDGHYVVAEKLSKIEKRKNCPLAVSISSDPDLIENDALPLLREAFRIFNKAGVDFIELNESCPNVHHNENSQNGILDINLINRLNFVSDKFLKHRNRSMPVIVKFAVDIDPELIPELIDNLIDMGFDGANFGNTVKNYSYFRPKIAENEFEIFDYFTEYYGGGISGNPLKESSLNCCKIAITARNNKTLNKEFAIIRTGGIQNYSDLEASNSIGVDLNQWFTGYFEMFADFGHKLYTKMYEYD